MSASSSEHLLIQFFHTNGIYSFTGADIIVQVNSYLRMSDWFKEQLCYS